MSLVYVILAVVTLSGVTCQCPSILATLTNVPEDGLFNFTQLSAKYHCTAIEHDVVTEDGYILKLFHIPGDRKRPVLFVHGVFDSSDGWIIKGKSSIAVILAKLGYDLWFLNFRGNRYSRRHVSLNPDKDLQFWEFSAHEYGVYDVSACIDRVLRATGQQQLSIVGFSEGTTATVILGATKPEYNDKVKVFVALAPVVYLQHVRSALSFIITISPYVNAILPHIIVEFGGYCSIVKALINLVCTQPIIGYAFCYEGAFSSLSGVDPEGIDRSLFPTVIGHFPDGTSRMNLMHFAQISLNARFAQYDHGVTKNLMMYRSLSPPEYDVSRVSMRTVLVSGDNDPVSTLEDTKILKEQLPNAEFRLVQRPRFNHLDHLWAGDAELVLYPEIVKILATPERELIVTLNL